MLWVCFSAEGTEGLVRVEEKFNAPKYRDSLNENPVQCIQNFRRAEGLPSKRTMDLNTQQEWLIDNSVNVLGGGGGGGQPELKLSQIFLEKHENVRLLPSNLTELER